MQLLFFCHMSVWSEHWPHIDGLVQERRNSSALAMELRLSCTNLSIWTAGEKSRSQNWTLRCQKSGHFLACILPPNFTFIRSNGECYWIGVRSSDIGQLLAQYVNSLRSDQIVCKLNLFSTNCGNPGCCWSVCYGSYGLECIRFAPFAHNLSKISCCGRVSGHQPGMGGVPWKSTTKQFSKRGRSVTVTSGGCISSVFLPKLFMAPIQMPILRRFGQVIHTIPIR